MDYDLDNFKRSYQMNLNDNQDDDFEDDKPKMGPKKRPRNYSSIIFSSLMALLFLGLGLFLIIRNLNIGNDYGDNDLVFNIDADNDGNSDIVDGYPDFALFYDNDKFDDGKRQKAFSVRSDTNPDGIVLPNTDDNKNRLGKLAEYLINTTDYSTSLSVVYSNINGNIMQLKGSVAYVKDGKKYGFNYTANISKITYEKYVDPIIKLTYRNEKLAYADVKASVQRNNNLTSWLVPLIIQIVVYGLAGFLIFRLIRSVSIQSGPNGMSSFVNNLAGKKSTSKVKFSDVAGCEEAKIELIEMVDYFRSTEKYTRLGAKLPHGVLLQGPPGTGKTLLAKAIAGEANVPFYSISGSDFVEMYVGVGASRVRSLFKSAKQNAPCLIFIDEIDAVGRQRGAGLGNGNDEREQTLNELLVEMDGFDDNPGIIVMAATNRSDVLDPALTRPGRFDRTITVDLPDKAGRTAILKVHARNKIVSDQVSYESIASRTVGFSGADLANIMNDAAILAVRANRDAITTVDIDEAIDRAVAGPAKNSHLEEKEKRQVAYHESGHAIIGLFLPYSDVVQKITIVPRGRTGGHVLMTPEKDRFLMTKNQLLARITGYLGGRSSEEIFFGDVSTGASNDIEVATSIARSMVTQYGMSNLGPIQYERPDGSVFLGRDYTSTQSNYSTQIAFEIDKEVRAIIDKCHDDAQKLIKEHKADVELIAETLIEKETITSDEISYLLKHRKLPKEEKKQEDIYVPKNSHNILLYPGFDEFYKKIDLISENNELSKLVIIIAEKNAKDLTETEFREVCTKNTENVSSIGVLFIDAKEASTISISHESFAFHLEAYCGVNVLLVKASEDSVKKLSKLTSSKKKDA